MVGEKKSEGRISLLEIKALRTHFFTEYGAIKAVDGVDLEIKKGEILGIAGESGCGKTAAGLSILRLIPSPPGKILGGEVLFRGRDLLSIGEREMRQLRGSEIGMIFQEPMTYLNPVFTIGDQIREVMTVHQRISKSEATNRAIDLLKKVGIASPKKRFKDYPHQFSGGMRQRVIIAMALACNPSLVIADEPTTALDVTIQAQILELLQNLKEEFKISLMLITHDLGVIATMADRLAVMYAGKIVEYGTLREIFFQARHPYTRGLLDSIPRFQGKKEKLSAISGQVPHPLYLPKGCKFYPRCKRATPDCDEQEPEIEWIGETHGVRCYNWNN
jgi:peptide/nickel transport system ATP-binding protein/oligopeptide transport system ATP-binding protein